ncbi:MAG: spore germination protein [Thermaerobacter sp.]|nr:spore germination protein [Thermaerobacter sp.]
MQATGSTLDAIGDIEQRGSRLVGLLAAMIDSPPKDAIGARMERIEQRLKALYLDSFPTVTRKFQTFGRHGLLLFEGGVVQRGEVDRDILRPLMEAQGPPPAAMQSIAQRVLPTLVATSIETWEQVEEHYEDGHAILFVDGIAGAIAIDQKKIPVRSPSAPKTESSVRGPQIGFLEDLKSNLVLLRDRVRTHRLKIFNHQVGQATRTQVVVMHIEGEIDPAIVTGVRERIMQAQPKDLQLISSLTGLLEQRPFSIFPQVRMTQRVDEAARALLQGRLVIMMHGDPTAGIYPSTLGDFYRTMQDYMMSFWEASYVRLIRASAALISLYLPALYVALTTINPDLLPTRLAIVVAGSREGIPFSPLVEVFLMFLIIEILREAALRMPSQMTATLGTVGAIVVGTALVKAGVVSDLMIVVATITAVAAFTAPSFEITSVWRILMWPMAIVAAIWGILGILVLTFVILSAMSSLEVAGMPYLAPLVPATGSDIRDTLIRLPMRALSPSDQRHGMLPWLTRSLRQAATRHPRGGGK